MGGPYHRRHTAQVERKQIKDVKRLVQTIQETEIGARVALEVLRQGRQMTLYPSSIPADTGKRCARFVFSYWMWSRCRAREWHRGSLRAGIVAGVTAIPLTQAVADGLQILVRADC